jgi:uncharacterized protein YjbJ (UPF0337 family)
VSQIEPTNASRSLFDKVAGVAKELVGSFVGNDDLAEEGELQQQKAAAANEAEQRAAEAEQAEAEAALKAEQAAITVEQQRVAAESAERQRERELDRDKAAAESIIAREVTQRAAQIAQQHDVEERVIDVREDLATRDLIEGAAAASAIELEAGRAEAAAEALRAAQEQSKKEI